MRGALGLFRGLGQRFPTRRGRPSRGCVEYGSVGDKL